MLPGPSLSGWQDLLRLAPQGKQGDEETPGARVAGPQQGADQAGAGPCSASENMRLDDLVIPTRSGGGRSRERLDDRAHPRREAASGRASC